MASVLLISADQDLAKRLREESSARGWSLTAMDHIPVDGLRGPGFGLVIADVNAKGTRDWLSDDARPDHPLTIAITDAASVTELPDWGVDDFVVAPVCPVELLARVDLLVGRFTKDTALPPEGERTVGFLESLINATADAFVVADMLGRIQLFNTGAERLSGHRADDVVGKLHLGEIFTASGADAVMARVLSQAMRGEARPDPLIIDVMAANGEAVPIRLSVTVASDGGDPNAIVLVFSDIRERLDIEQRLADAQKKLVFTDKQSVMAELAGTAAHKLNQPLTSVMAYAELLKQKSEPGSVGETVSAVLLQEADRMADIVRKLGRIARYETTSYVGSQKIFDLDRATEARESGEVEKGS